ncbi:glycosyltransferase [Accumulibacter sp.]|uniref:glycosyltransferase n=1 Tax=Accumulibacter sp. TaxID=2053492 RepID=UPI0035B335D9
MIFVTVGSQMPFDRLILSTDRWLRAHPSAKVVAQIGDSKLGPMAMETCRILPPKQFTALLSEAEIVVSHAGMGTIITAAEFHKPLVLLARRGSLRETRNDHQVATANRLRGKPGIFVAESESEIPDAISCALRSKAAFDSVPTSRNVMVDRLRDLIHLL